MSDGPEKSDVPPGRRTAEDETEEPPDPESDEQTEEGETGSGLDSPTGPDQEERDESADSTADELFDAFDREDDSVDSVGQQQPAIDREQPATEPETQEKKPVSEMSFEERVTAADDAIRKSRRGLDPETILEYTTDRRSLSPQVQLEWGVWTSLYVVILTLVFTFILGNFGLDPRFGTLFLIVLFITGVVWVSLRYRKWVYQVRADSLYLERGVLTHRRTLVPYVRIQHVDTRRGVLERWLGLSTLVVYTAGSRGADVSIPGLEPDEARDLQQRVKELAIEAEGGDAL